MMKNQNRFLILGLVLLAGCGSMASSQPSASEKQDAALEDPMGYKQQVGRDISGGDITHFDHDGFKQDMNDALNP